MAITGQGTQGDPYIVHSYNEIKEAITRGHNSFGSALFYMELGNDIDCNDYGTTFEWETIGVNNSSSVHYNFDLKGHTIKNFKVKSGNSVFQHAGGAASVVKNGKILNVYLGNAIAFCTLYSGVYTYSSLQNLSISINAGTTITEDYMFRCGISRCAIYIEGSTNKHIFTTYPSIGGTITDTDFLFNFTQSHSLDYIESSGRGIERCRFRGTLGHNTDDYIFRNYVINSVIDVVTDAHYSAYSGGAQNRSTIINRTKAPNITYFQDMIPVTSEEIINGDALRAKGFEVVNVLE